MTAEPVDEATSPATRHCAAEKWIDGYRYICVILDGHGPHPMHFFRLAVVQRKDPRETLADKWVGG